MSTTARNSVKLSFFTIISRVLGLVRDHYQAIFFGTGPIATAWEIAYMLPNMLRNLLAEGVLSQAFIPVYSDALKGSEREGRRVAGVIITFLFFFLVVFVLLGIALFPVLIPIYTGKSQEESSLIITLSQIMFVFILTTSLTAIFAGISNTHKHFVIPSLSPVILNLIFISSFLFLLFRNYGEEKNVRFLAWCVVAGGFVQLSFQAWHVSRIGSFPSLSVRFRDPALKKIFSLMAPAVLGAGLFQFNQLMDIALASYFIPDEVGAVPALRYAHRLIQLPTGIIGVALSTAILPSLVAQIRAGTAHQNTQELAFALSFSFFLTVPAGIGLYLLGPDIINLIFYGGAWGISSTQATWFALQFYCIGVPFYSANKILTSTHYAYQDTRTPIRIMIITVIVNLLLNITLIHSMQHGALALSTSVSATLNTVLLYVTAKKKLQRSDAGEFFRSCVRQLPLWGALALYLYLLKHVFSGELEWIGSNLIGSGKTGLTVRETALLNVGVGIAGGMALYFGLAIGIGNRELKVFGGFLRKKGR